MGGRPPTAPEGRDPGEIKILKQVNHARAHPQHAGTLRSRPGGRQQWRWGRLPGTPLSTWPSLRSPEARLQVRRGEWVLS